MSWSHLPTTPASAPIGASNVRVTEVDVGSAVAYNEGDHNGGSVGLKPIAIAHPRRRLPARVARRRRRRPRRAARRQRPAGRGVRVQPPRVRLPRPIYADSTGGVAPSSVAPRRRRPEDRRHDGRRLPLLATSTTSAGLVANYPTMDPCMGSCYTWCASTTARPRPGPPSSPIPTPALPAYGTAANATANVTIFIWWYAHATGASPSTARTGARTSGAAISTGAVVRAAEH